MLNWCNCDKKTITDIFPEWKTSGAILSKIATVGTLPWANDNYDNFLLDVDYIGHSGNKRISPLVEKFMGTDGTISEPDILTIAKVIYQRYRVSWAKLYNTLKLEYNPIENYRMTETEGGNSTTTSESASNGTGETTVESNNNIFGYNSETGVPSDEGRSRSSSTDTTNTNGSSATRQNRELTRSGNIGVTTSQQMLEAERNVWIWDFFEKVFNDIDKIICLEVY